MIQSWLGRLMNALLSEEGYGSGILAAASMLTVDGGFVRLHLLLLGGGIYYQLVILARNHLHVRRWCRITLRLQTKAAVLQTCGWRIMLFLF